MPEPVELKGRPASPGIAVGPLARLTAEVGARAATGDPQLEREALQAAIAAAIAQIESLMAAADAEGAGILEFQAAMLGDDELAAPALLAIEAGAGADAAWAGALAEQVDTYAGSDDAYFRARAADIGDLRDRVLRNLLGASACAIPPGAILAAEDLTPTRFLETDWTGGGIALGAGSAASHVAMLARSRGVPMVVGIGTVPVDGHVEALVDGGSGRLVLSPGPDERARADRLIGEEADARLTASQYLNAPAVTADGTPIRVMINIARPEEVDAIDVATCDGVGLMRTEFLFGGATLPDEDAQYLGYAKVVKWAGGRPVTIRTIDAGGDKPVAGLTVEEPNPFLGLRGIRMSLARPDVFRVQLRALARAAAHGNLKIMLPMVTVPGEIATAAAHLDIAVADLAQAGIAAARPALGIMVEVPAVAIIPEAFTAAAFFSIGSNDLTQYVTAAARDSSRVAELNDVSHPAVLRLIREVAEFGIGTGMEVSLCGDAAADPALVPTLLRSGLRSLSVAPSALAAVKAAVAEVRLGDGDAG